MNIEEYFYAAVLSHVSRQQIPTGPVYTDSELRDKINAAAGVEIPPEIVSQIIVRLESNRFAEITQTPAAQYIKLIYKTIHGYVQDEAWSKSSYLYQYNRVGPRLLEDLLAIYESSKPEFISDDKNSEIPKKLPVGFVLNEEKRVNLIRAIDYAQDEADRELADNATKAQAHAMLAAAKSLSEAPDPPTDLIWDIVTRASAIAGIASLFVSIIAIFLG